MAEKAGNESPVQYGEEKISKEYNEMSGSPDASPIGDYQPGSDAEKKLLRKLDSRIIVRSSTPPFLSI